jgi:HD superfamily phosphohydrolase
MRSKRKVGSKTRSTKTRPTKTRRKSRAGQVTTRVRTIRDPIHGDIELRPLLAAVVDTRIFQRLRYIRQNGLLHFVFPGAVHTRFAHSIGTMWLAGRAFDRIFRGVAGTKKRAVDYLRDVFQLAGLLHDVGHCAFSHSIETVTIEGKPLLGTVRQFLRAWDETELEKIYFAVYADKADVRVEHEQIGLALVRRIFEEESVAVSAKAAGYLAKDMWRDVCAIMDGGLPVSASFEKNALDVASSLVPGLKVNRSSATKQHFVDDLLVALHTLISGTLDVDRLDYLVRDSVHCGVPYGKCEVSLILASLRFEAIGGRLELCISRKASRAIEDMLWSRYQLFIQVLNHKTNIALNVLLRKAIEDAITDKQIKRPRTPIDYLEFTDDLVMSNIFSASLRKNLSSKTYTKALTDRRVPQQLDEFDVGDKQSWRIEVVARQFGLKADQVLMGEAKSEFVKGTSPLPKVIGVDRLTNQRDVQPFDLASIKNIPLSYHRIHLFADRDDVQKAIKERSNG